MKDVPYSFGCKLSGDGLYSSYGQYDAARNRDLLPQHMYIYLWMNVSSLSMSLLSKQISSEDLITIIGDNVPINLFFEQNMIALWNFMQTNFSFLHEEVDYLVTTIMLKVLNVSDYYHIIDIVIIVTHYSLQCQNQSNDEEMWGLFTSREKRDLYEMEFVKCVIVPGITSFIDNVSR